MRSAPAKPLFVRLAHRAAARYSNANTRPARACMPATRESTPAAAMLSRRALLTLPPAVLFAAPIVRAAEGGDPLGEGQPVRPALPAGAYVKQLRMNRAPALSQLRSLIADGDFAGINVAVVIAPFDDLRQAAYFLPWAVVHDDEAAGTTLENAYVALREAWKGLDAAAADAARYAADEADVSAALAAFETALDTYEACIPAALAQ